MKAIQIFLSQRSDSFILILGDENKQIEAFVRNDGPGDVLQTFINI